MMTIEYYKGVAVGLILNEKVLQDVTHAIDRFGPFERTGFIAVLPGGNLHVENPHPDEAEGIQSLEKFIHTLPPADHGFQMADE